MESILSKKIKELNIRWVRIILAIKYSMGRNLKSDKVISQLKIGTGS